MSIANDTRVRQPYVIGLGITVCVILPLIVSSQQAGRFFQSLGTGTDATILFMTACAIIFSSPTLAVLISQTGNEIHKRLAVFVCFLIMIFSVITTTVAIHGKISEQISGQTASSATNTTLQSTIDSNLATIASLQEQIDSRDPIRWATKRGEWAMQIQLLQSQNMDLIRQQKEHRESGGGSSTGETFARLAEYGITPFGFAVFAATLLDLITFTACLIMGGMVAVKARAHLNNRDSYKFNISAKGEEEKGGKKSQPLRAA